MQLDTPVKIAVAMACFNRRETTLACLDRLINQASAKISVSVYILDDASTDGTSQAIRAKYPTIRILQGNGQCYWGQGMHLAMKAALEHSFDYLLWLNDDVMLKNDALTILISSYHTAMHSEAGAHVIVGATDDPRTGQISYCGFRKKFRWHPSNFEKVLPSPDALIPCDTMNGNCVLLPRPVVDRVGLIDTTYIHQIGDIDYGYRVKKIGGNIWVASSVIGSCTAKSCPVLPESLWDRLKGINAPLNYPIKAWFKFFRKYGGKIGFILFMYMYAKLLVYAALNLSSPPKN